MIRQIFICRLFCSCRAAFGLPAVGRGRAPERVRGNSRRRRTIHRAGRYKIRRRQTGRYKARRSPTGGKTVQLAVGPGSDDHHRARSRRGRGRQPARHHRIAGRRQKFRLGQGRLFPARNLGPGVQIQADANDLGRYARTQRL